MNKKELIFQVKNYVVLLLDIKIIVIENVQLKHRLKIK